MTEREAFEAWASDNGEWPQCIERSGDSYTLMQTKLKWEAWQAARALPAQAGHVPEASCGECGKKASDGWALYCVACMEEAGLPAVTDSPPLMHSCTSSLGKTPDSIAQAVPLKQILTDPENQPNQYGVEFLMHGPKFAFKVGAQQFTLDYEPTEPGEYEFMQAALIYAFSTFTPDVNTAQAGPMLTESELRSILQGTNHMVKNAMHGAFWPELEEACRAIEQAVRAKCGIVGKEGA